MALSKKSIIILGVAFCLMSVLNGIVSAEAATGGLTGLIFGTGMQEAKGYNLYINDPMPVPGTWEDKVWGSKMELVIGAQITVADLKSIKFPSKAVGFYGILRLWNPAEDKYMAMSGVLYPTGRIVFVAGGFQGDAIIVNVGTPTIPKYKLKGHFQAQNGLTASFILPLRTNTTSYSYPY